MSERNGLTQRQILLNQIVDATLDIASAQGHLSEIRGMRDTSQVSYSNMRDRANRGIARASARRTILRGRLAAL